MTIYEILLKLCHSVDDEDTVYRIIDATVDANLLSEHEAVRLEDAIGLT